MRATLNNQNWEPAYPASESTRVKLENDWLLTDIYKRLPYVCYSDEDEPLEDPACFWIDSAHVYMRCNWGKWCTVSTFNDDHIKQLLGSSYCYVGYAKDENTVKCAVAPVYHITKLPKDVFEKTSYIEEYRRLFPKKEDECSFDPGIALEELRRSGKPSSNASDLARLYNLYYESADLRDFADLFKDDLKFGLNAKVKEDAVDLAVRKDGQVLLLDFLDDAHWDSFPVNFRKLRRMRRHLKKTDPFAQVEIGIVADPRALEDILEEDYDLADLRLIPRDKLKKNIYSVFYLNKC
jgi:hypothetical protein